MHSTFILLEVYFQVWLLGQKSSVYVALLGIAIFSSKWVARTLLDLAFSELVGIQVSVENTPGK